MISVPLYTCLKSGLGNIPQIAISEELKPKFSWVACPQTPIDDLVLTSLLYPLPLPLCKLFLKKHWLLC